MFEVVYDKKKWFEPHEYTYRNNLNPSEEYIRIFTKGTDWLKSFVTFKPANIPDAPVMVVDTNKFTYIRLPRSVDEWEIKYYSNFRKMYPPYDKYLKNAGVVNLDKEFENLVEDGLYLELSNGQFISTNVTGLDAWSRWSIPGVD